jgi:hypothetical protein
MTVMNTAQQLASRPSWDMRRVGAADMGIGLLPAFTNPYEQGRQKDRQLHYRWHWKGRPKLICGPRGRNTWGSRDFKAFRLTRQLRDKIFVLSFLSGNIFTVVLIFPENFPYSCHGSLSFL